MVTKARGEDVSDFVRRAIRIELAKLSYLSAKEKKALGIKPEAILKEKSNPPTTIDAGRAKEVPAE